MLSPSGYLCGAFAGWRTVTLQKPIAKICLSALIINQRLTHLCLAKNALGDRGVKLLCEGLTYS